MFSVGPLLTRGLPEGTLRALQSKEGTMASTSALLDDIIEETAGKFQFVLIAIVLGSKFPITWSMLMMTFGGAIPDWWCKPENTTTSPIFETFNKSSSLKVCVIANMSNKCESYSYTGEMTTVVNQWNLVCDRDWITSTITTIQMGGLLAGGFISGQLADYIGRKPTYFLSFLLLTIFNAAAVFSVSWQMFSIFRFLIGFACGCYLTVFFTFLAEFTPSKWRPVIMGIPGWPVWAALYGFFSWWLHDWKYLQIATAVVSAPPLLAWFFMPESFRWLVSHKKFDDAEKILFRIASINNKPLPDITKLRYTAEKEWKEEEMSRKYTVVDVCSNWTIAKHTLLISIIWLCCGYGYYAIAFGVQELSGNLYLNMFLLSIVEAPAQFITWFFNNCIGRKWTCVGFYLIAGFAGLVVGSVELTDILLKHQLINGFAITAKLAVAAAWAANMVLASEIYPTVIRNISYGINNSISRIGGMIAPQIVFISQKIPGTMYFLFGGTMLLSALCSVLLPETKNRVMTDLIDTKGRYENKTASRSIHNGDIILENQTDLYSSKSSVPLET